MNFDLKISDDDGTTLIKYKQVKAIHCNIIYSVNDLNLGVTVDRVPVVQLSR